MNPGDVMHGDVIIVHVANVNALPLTGVKYAEPAIFMFSERITDCSYNLHVIHEGIQIWWFDIGVDSIELVCKFKDVI